MNPNARFRAGLVLGAALLLTTSGTALAQDAGQPGEWLTRYSSARSLGLGGAYVATADDPLGVLWNPAGLSFMDRNEVRFENSHLFEQTSINALGFAVPGSRWPSLGVSVVSLGSGDFQRTNDVNDPLGTFSEGETAYLITASKAVSPRFSLGANFKLVQQTLESYNGGGFGMDAGALLHLTPHLGFGLSMQNLGGPTIKLRDVAETYPTGVRGGASYAVLDGRGMVALELDQVKGLGAKVHGGVEYWIQSGLGLRMGYDDNGGSAGISLRIRPQYQIDYAAADHPLGLEQRVGMSVRFGGFFASSAADPEVFSPTGEHAVTRITLAARTKADPANWSLEVIDKSDAVVRRFGGDGQPPSHLQWDGKDETGLPLPDGSYRYSLVVKDVAGRVVHGPVRAVEISTTGPQGNVPLIPVAGSGANGTGTNP
jgi:hypothetical protein